MEITPATLALIAAASSLVGVVISSLFSLWTTWLNKSYELRKQRQELAMEAAIENWKKIVDLAAEMSRTKHQKFIVPPLGTFMLRMVKIAELSDDPKVNQSNIRQKLEEIDKIIDVVDAYTEEKTNQLYKDRT